jgi:hypothetical protein
VRTTQVAAIDTTDATFTINRLEALANVTRATRTLDDLTASATSKELSHRRDLMAEVATLTHQRDALLSALKNGRNSLGLTKGQDPFQAAAEGHETLTFSIMRRSAKGYATFEADDVTPLLPGDVLRVAVRQLNANQAVATQSTTRALSQ